MINVYDRNGIALGSFNNDVPFGCPYFEDVFVEDSLTQEVSLSFQVPLGRPESKWLDAFSKVTIKDSDGELRLFNVTEVFEDWKHDQAIKQVYAEDVATTELNQTYTQPFRATRLEDAMRSALSESKWEYNIQYNATVDEDNAFEVTDYTKVKGVLTNIMDIFEVSMKFTAVTSMFGIEERVIQVFSNKGNDTGKYFYYDRDLQGLTRNIEFSDVKTAVIPVGKDINGGIVKLNDWSPKTPVEGFQKDFTRDFIVDTNAQEKYGDITTDFRFLLYQNDELSDKTLLYYNAINELRKANAPIFTYNLSVLLLEQATGIQGEEVHLGDIVWFKDSIGDVEIGIEARVVRLEISSSDPSKNTVQFSNFREISVMDSQDVLDLRKQLEALGNTVTNQGNEIAELTLAQQGILVSLDGKSSISLGPAPNPNPKIGDTWFEPGKDSKGRDTVRIRTYNGTEWVSQFDTETVNQVGDAVNQAQEDAGTAIQNAATATGKADSAISSANAAALEAKKAIEGQGNLVNNFSISGNFDRWNTSSLGGLVMQTVPYLNGQDVKALYSSGEANQIYSNTWIPLDPTKMYEVSIWALSENNQKSFHFGLFSDGEITRVNKNTGVAVANDTNPYFLAGSPAPTGWTKYTGYFAPNGTDPLTLRDAGGNNLNNFIQTQTNGSFSMRFLNYPTTKPRKMWFANPSIFEVNPDQMNRNASFKVGMDAISLEVSNKANKSEVTQLAGQITSTVTELNQVQAGRNFQRNIQVGYAPAPGGTSITKVGTNSLDIKYPGGAVTDAYAWLQEMPELVNGITYTFKASIILKDSTTSTNTIGLGVRNTGSADKRDIALNKLNYVPVTITFKYVKPPTGSPRVMIFPITKSEAFTITVKDVSVTEGSSIPSQWFPSFLDYASQTQIVQLTDQVSIVAQTSEDNKAGISLLTDNINLMVRKDDVINQINVSTEGILIDGVKTHITGQTTIDNAVIKDAMISSLTASKLTTGTIDAGIINVVNLNAAEIKSGTIQGIDIVGSTITNNFDYTEGTNRFIGTAILSKNKLSFNYALSGSSTTGLMEISPLAVNSTILNSGAFVSGWEVSGSGFYTVAGNPSAGGSSLALGMNGINVLKEGGGIQYQFSAEGLNLRPTVGTATRNTSIELYGLNTYIDFHSNNNTNDYQVRLIASGGTSVNGSGALTAYGTSFAFMHPNGGGISYSGNSLQAAGNQSDINMRPASNGVLTSRTSSNVWRPMQASSFDVQSDKADKKNIKPLTGALWKILSTPVYKYNRSDEYDFENKHTGLMLQEAPVDIVSPSGSIDVYGVASMAFAGIQDVDYKFEQSIEELKEVIKSQQDQIDHIMNLLGQI